MSCRYADLPAGRYAVSVAHDRNGNRKLDTNFLGVPVEAWGVSRNARPALRPPRFDEAAVDVGADGRTTIQVEVAK